KDYGHSIVSVGIVHATGFGDVCKGAIAIVVIERVARAFQSARATLHVNAAVLAVGSRSECRQIIQVKVHIVRHHQIEIAVAIVISKGSPRGPAAVSDAGLRCHVGESAVAVVSKKLVATETGDVKVRPSVIVVVADRTAHGKARSCQASLVGYVGGRPNVVVLDGDATGRVP